MSAAEVLAVDAGAGARLAAGSDPAFLRSELGIIFGRRRNLAGLAVLAVVPIILAIAVKVSVADGGGGGPDFIARSPATGCSSPSPR